MSKKIFYIVFSIFLFVYTMLSNQVFAFSCIADSELIENGFLLRKNNLDLITDGGKELIGSKEGLFIYNNGTLESIQDSNTGEIYDFYQLNNGRIILATNNGWFDYFKSKLNKIGERTKNEINKSDRSALSFLYLPINNDFLLINEKDDSTGDSLVWIYKDNKVSLINGMVEGNRVKLVEEFSDGRVLFKTSGYNSNFSEDIVRYYIYDNDNIYLVKTFKEDNLNAIYHMFDDILIINDNLNWNMYSLKRNASNTIYEFAKSNNEPFGKILDIKKSNKNKLFIITNKNKLYYVDKDNHNSIEIKIEGNVKYLNNIIHVDGKYLISSSEGLYFFENEKIRKYNEIDFGEVNEVYKLDNERVLLFTDAGLYIYKENRIQIVSSSQDVGGTYLYYMDTLDDGSIMFKLDKGWFKYDTITNSLLLFSEKNIQTIDDLKMVKDGEIVFNDMKELFLINNTTTVNSNQIGSLYIDELYSIGSQNILLRSDNVWYVYDNYTVKQVKNSLEQIVSKVISIDINSLLILSDQKLFVYNDGEISKLFNQDVDKIVKFDDNNIFFVSKNKLYRYFKTIKAVPGNKRFSVNDIVRFNDDSLIVSSYQSLIQLNSSPLDKISDIKFEKTGEIAVGRMYDLGFVFQHICASHIPLSLRITKVNSIKNNSVKVIGSNSITYLDNDNRFIARLPDSSFTKKGTYIFQLYGQEDNGEWIRLGKPEKRKVGWDIIDYIQYYSPRLLGFGVIIHAVLFLILICSAHWSNKCFEIVISKGLWGKMGLYYRWVIRMSPRIQIWLFETYYQSIRSEIRKQKKPYSNVTITSSNIENNYTTEHLFLLLRKYPKLWLQGNPGMGKTAVIKNLEQKYFGDKKITTLGAAYKKFGFIPIIVTVRDIRNEPLEQGKDWVLDAACIAMDKSGILLDDKDFLFKMFRNGCFAIVLDGLNEVERNDEVNTFASSEPNVNLLVTSQENNDGNFSVFRLPINIKDYIKKFLILYLEEEKGRETFELIKDSGLINSIDSGYDVEMIIEMVNDDEQLPTTRLELYKHIVERSKDADGTPLHYEQLFELSWKQYKAGKRIIESSAENKSLIKSLNSEGNKVLSVIGGNYYEFRHDLLRAYLAARWLVDESSSIEALINWIDIPEIWKFGKNEQTELFSFVAEMLMNEDAANCLLKFAAENPIERNILQYVLITMAKQKGWSLLVNFKG